MPGSHLESLGGLSDDELRRLATLASDFARRQAPDSPPSWRAFWHELAVLAAEELNDRRAVESAAERAALGLPAEPETGAIVAEGGPSWSQDDDPLSRLEDEKRFEEFLRRQRDDGE